MRSNWLNSLSGWAMAASLLAASSPAVAKKAATAKKAPVEASAQTVRAVGELAGKFKWGMTPEEVTKVVVEDIQAKFDERVRKETSPFRQDAVRHEMGEQIQKFKESFVKFDGQKTGWDVSIIDREFVHKNGESMAVIWEKDQRRFLFFFQDHLWKQFIAFNAENPVFAGKTFDDFADIIQHRYGPASMTFRKLKTSDDQTLDHLEWPPAGDYSLWAIDLTTFYGNFCLSLMQKSKIDEIEKGRKENGPKHQSGNALVDAAMKGEAATKADMNSDIIDQITGRGAEAISENKPAAASKGGKKGHAEEEKKESDKPAAPADPLEGTQF